MNTFKTGGCDGTAMRSSSSLLLAAGGFYWAAAAAFVLLSSCQRAPVTAQSRAEDLRKFFEPVPPVQGQTLVATLDGRPVTEGSFPAGATMLFQLVAIPPKGKLVSGEVLSIDVSALTMVNFYALGGVDGTVTSEESGGRPAIAISSDRTRVLEEGWFLKKEVDGKAVTPTKGPPVIPLLKPGEPLTFECRTVLPSRPGTHTLAVVNQYRGEVNQDTGINVMRSLLTLPIIISGDETS